MCVVSCFLRICQRCRVPDCSFEVRRRSSHVLLIENRELAAEDSGEGEEGGRGGVCVVPAFGEKPVVPLRKIGTLCAHKA